MATDRRRAGRAKPPLEYSMLYTATLCLLAAGAVMVYSASSAESLLTTGDSSFYLKRYVIFGALGRGAAPRPIAPRPEGRAQGHPDPPVRLASACRSP